MAGSYHAAEVRKSKGLSEQADAEVLSYIGQIHNWAQCQYINTSISIRLPWWKKVIMIVKIMCIHQVRNK